MQTAGTFNLHRPSKYRQIEPNEALWIVADFGNKDAKVMIHGRFGEEIWFPNYMALLDDDEYRAQQLAHRNSPAQYEKSAIFKTHEGGLIVGELAQTMSGAIQKKGAYKYGQYIRDLFTASMLHLYPQGHRKINLVVTHPVRLPPREIEELKNSFAGEISIETVDGREVRYLVRNVLMIEEPKAAFQTYALNTNGMSHQRRAFKLEPGTTFAICDVGGYLSALALGKVNSKMEIEISATNMRPIDYGIHHVVESFTLSMRNAIPELSKVSTLPLERVTEALKTDVYRIGRKDERNVSKIVENAFAPLMGAFLDTYEQPPFSMGVGLDGVILTAGGNALAQEYLTANLFGDGFAVPAEDDVEVMRYCAIRGASKGLTPFLAQLDYQKAMRRAEKT